ncbi:hypothetical protein [Winogradskyella luteola]|uniref:Uncharacterized protein n=1 Tax=Winogradskyella luteola TaxID=2828330 RepID=A0A9X1JQ03_9FLAO|nr:hypothetical protein [Winogradskyella luteola]MBV7269259.1 hypothetical protein [Winogradskyella luteola]
MNYQLAPTYQRLFGSYWVLWYSKSNNYSIVELEFKILLDNYFQSNSLDEFASKIALHDDVSDPKLIAKQLQSYLKGCNTAKASIEKANLKFKPSHCKTFKQYDTNGKLIQINYDSELVKKTIHPSIAHLEVKQKEEAQITFDIYLDNDQLCLFRDKQLIRSVPKRDYHLLQGKFVMELLSVIHNKQESDWIGTFHGSTITDGHNSILFVGQSGKGKSTLCAILAANGYELLADDVSPILSEDCHIYHNPSAISIKKGAFGLLQSVVKNFDELPITVFNTSKGAIKYVPFPNTKKNSYPCKAIVMVNYNNGAKLNLENTSVKTLLETLIPDSWLSPNTLHAKQFLDWLETVDIYQLTYSETESVKTELSSLFQKLKKNQ